MDNILNMGYQLYYIRRINTEMYQYQLTASESAAEENGKVTYGISITDKNGICGKIEDISPDKAEMEKLVSLCNELQLDPIHLEDIVDDFLSTLTVL